MNGDMNLLIPVAVMYAAACTLLGHHSGTALFPFLMAIWSYDEAFSHSHTGFLTVDLEGQLTRHRAPDGTVLYLYRQFDIFVNEGDIIYRATSMKPDLVPASWAKKRLSKSLNCRTPALISEKRIGHLSLKCLNSIDILVTSNSLPFFSGP